MSESIRKQIRDHIESEAKLLAWFRSDAAGESTPQNLELTDLDSFTVVQLVLSIEEAHDVDLLGDLAEFTGKTFDDLVDFTVRRIEAA